MSKRTNKKLVKEWLSLADNDLGFAQAAYNDFDDYYSQICIQAHQAIEKYLKGFLTFYNIKFRLTHDLSYLVKECLKIDKDFEKYLDLCKKITDYYIFLRYPVTLPSRTKKEAGEAIKAAKNIRALIKKINL